MPLDFSNRKPDDPNGIASVRPSSTPAWVNPADWSGFTTNPGEKKGKLEIRFATVTLNDGRQFRAILDQGSQPISEIGDQIGFDEDQVRVWQQRQSLQARADQEGDTRGPQNLPTREVFRGGKWVVEPNPIYQGQQGDAPPGGKPFVDDGPEAGQSGRRWGWNPQTRMYDRDLGPSPAAQKPTSETVRTPVQGKPGVYQVTTKDATTGRTETHFENEQGQTVPTPTADPQETKRTITRNGKTYIEVSVKKPDGTSDIYHTDQAGTRVELPAEEKDGSYQPLPNGVPRFIPDLTSIDLGLGERKAALDALVNQGVITKDQAASTIRFDAEIAVTAGRNAGSIVNIQEGNRSAALTARGQDATDASSRRSFAQGVLANALSGFDSTTGKILAGQGEAATAGLASRIGLGMALAQQMGGMKELPAYDLNQFPMLAAMGAAGVPGLPGGPPLSTTWPFPGLKPPAPTAATPTAPAPPNAIGVPTAPPGGGITINVTAPGQSAAAPSAPVFAPPPPVSMGGPATSALMRSMGMGHDPMTSGLADDLRAAGFDDDVPTLAFGASTPGTGLG